MAARILAALLLGCLALPIQAQETPLAVYRDSLANNPAYKAARANRDAEQENSSIALGQLLPSLSLNSSQSRNYVEKETPGFAGNRITQNFDYDGYAHSINVRQPIFRPYSIAAYQQAGKQGHLADSRLNETRDELVVKTLSSYLDAAYADQLIELLGAQKASVEAQARAAEKAFAAGIGTKIEISEANARRDIILAQELEAQNQQDHARRTLRALVGRPIGPLSPLQPERLSTALPRPIPLSEWIASAEAGSPELISARAQAEVAEKEVSKARSGHYPTLDLIASRNLSGNESLATLSALGDTNYRQNSVGVQLVIPVFSGGATSAQVRQAQAKLEQARFLAEDVQQNLEVKIRREYSNIVQGALKTRAHEQAESSAAQSVLATRKGIQAGIRTSLDVLKAEEQLYTTRRDLALSRYQLILARLRLLVLSGKLTDEDISLISNWFAPKAAGAL